MTLFTHFWIITLHNLAMIVHEFTKSCPVVVHVPVVKETPSTVAIATAHHATSQSVEGLNVVPREHGLNENI